MTLMPKIISLAVLSNNLSTEVETMIQNDVKNEIDKIHHDMKGSPCIINFYDILSIVLLNKDISNKYDVLKTFDNICVATNVEYIKFQRGDVKHLYGAHIQETI